MTPPRFPAGECISESHLTSSRRAELMSQIASAPADLEALVSGLSEEELDTKYVNWSVRQIVHHLADSHVHCYARFKWALTESEPTIKPYDETRQAALPDSVSGDIRQPLALLHAIHARWLQLLQSLSPEQFARTYYHPELQAAVTLDAALCDYAWHGQHHTAQICWLRDQGRISQ